MFTELEPLLADRTLLLTLSAVPGGAIRVNVIPKCRNENDAAEKALATPLSVTGTAVELDRDLPAQLTGYVQSILETDSTLNQIREAHKAAVKELEAENKKALDAKRKTNTSCKPVTKPDDKPDSKDDIKKATESKIPSPVVSLFDEPPEPIAAAADPKTAEHVTA
ncbi:MAG TPA: PRTRC system protein E [Bryobacteraceae bacterium]|jgi:PRTRC genetic system protein E|nr:PRTRC system protein E [Bryobacteraceae bacterium]